MTGDPGQGKQDTSVQSTSSSSNHHHWCKKTSQPLLENQQLPHSKLRKIPQAHPRHSPLLRLSLCNHTALPFQMVTLLPLQIPDGELQSPDPPPWLPIPPAHVMAGCVVGKAKKLRPWNTNRAWPASKADRRSSSYHLQNYKLHTPRATDMASQK